MKILIKKYVSPSISNNHVPVVEQEEKEIKKMADKNSLEKFVCFTK